MFGFDIIFFSDWLPIRIYALNAPNMPLYLSAHLALPTNMIEPQVVYPFMLLEHARHREAPSNDYLK